MPSSTNSGARPLYATASDNPCFPGITSGHQFPNGDKPKDFHVHLASVICDHGLDYKVVHQGRFYSSPLCQQVEAPLVKRMVETDGCFS